MILKSHQSFAFAVFRTRRIVRSLLDHGQLVIALKYKDFHGYNIMQ